MAGTNDLGAGCSAEDIVHDVRGLHSACHAVDIQTVALSIPPFGGSVATEEVLGRWRSANLHLKRWAQSCGQVVAFVETAQLVPFEEASDNWESDGIHFASGGSEALGRGLASIIGPFLTVNRSGKRSQQSREDDFYELVD